MKPIYKPTGAAKEYGEYAINIYTGCPHRCFYCYCPRVLHKNPEDFFSNVQPRKNIVEETRSQLEKDETLRGKTIHLCFSCDPYPTGYDSTPTREIIKLLKEYGNHVQILTKGDGSRDADLLDGMDWYGVTIDGSESLNELVDKKLVPLSDIKAEAGAKTWASFEPVVSGEAVLFFIRRFHHLFDRIKIGKLNYYPSDIDWKRFGEEAEELCQECGVEYYIKESLRKEMEK